MAPLLGANRSLVHSGLEAVQQSERCGLRALMAVASRRAVARRHGIALLRPRPATQRRRTPGPRAPQPRPPALRRPRRRLRDGAPARLPEPPATARDRDGAGARLEPARGRRRRRRSLLMIGHGDVPRGRGGPRRVEDGGGALPAGRRLPARRDGEPRQQSQHPRVRRRRRPARLRRPLPALSAGTSRRPASPPTTPACRQSRSGSSPTPRSSLPASTWRRSSKSTPRSGCASWAARRYAGWRSWRPTASATASPCC